MKLYEILIPIASNDGTPYSIEFHQKWDGEIVKRLGGLTLAKTAFDGIYKNSMREKTIAVRVACDPSDIYPVLGFTADYYDQKAIMAYEVSPHVIIYEKV